MVCQVKYKEGTRDPESVWASNGEDSMLFKSIVHKVSADYRDQHVETALRKGVVEIDPRTGMIPKRQVALVLWNKWYTEPDIKKRIEERAKQQGQKVIYDANGEPAFFEVEHEIMKGGGEQKDVADRIGVKPITRFLQKSKLVRKIGRKLILSEALTHAVEGLYDEGLSAVEVNRLRVQKVLKWFGLPEGFVSFKKEKEGVAVSFSQPSVQTATLETEPKTNTQTLVDFLRDRFPQLNMQYISVREAKALFQEREQKMEGSDRGKLDFDQVNSFTHKGTVYLIEGRVTDQVAAEEALHPFVYTISKNNAPLFAKLLEAAKKDFPGVHMEVQRAYTDKAGFTEEDRNLELVTQALGRTFKKEYETQAPQSVLKLLRDVLKWFGQLVKDFGVFIGANKVTVNVANLPADATLTSLAQLLNTYDSQFLVDTTAPNFNFSLTTERQLLLIKLKKKCRTPLQERIVEDLFAIEARIFMDKDHVYTNEKGDVFTSMTTSIGGKFDDEEGRYLRNRMFGNDFDMMMDALAQDIPYSRIKEKVKALSPEIAKRAYDQMRTYMHAIKQDGSVVIPQLRLYDPGTEGATSSQIAGTLDLLIVKPDGSMMVIDLKVSKHSIKSDEYKQKHKTKEGSRLPNTALSTRDKQGIQVGGYKRLLEVNGYYPTQTITYHMNVKLKVEDKVEQVRDFYAEGPVHHVESAYQKYVDRIISTQPAQDRTRLLMRELGMLSEDVDLEAEHDEALKRSEVFQKILEQMRAGMEEFREKVRRRIDRMELTKTAVSFNSPANRMMHKLSVLVMTMGQDLSAGQTQQAYGAFLRHAKEELKELSDYMSDPKNRDEEGFIEKVLEAAKYLETYRGMVNSGEWAMGNKVLDDRLKSLLLDLNTVQTKIRNTLENYVLDVMMKTTSKKEISRQEWEVLIKQGTDISQWDYYLGDIDSSTDPLIAVAAKLYKRSKMKADDRVKEFENKLYDWGAKLKQFFGKTPDFSDIYEVDEKGKRTGRYVQKTGPVYGKIRDKIRSMLLDSDGKLKQFRKVYVDDEEVNEEDVAYNKHLQEEKKEWREFNQAEVQTADGVQDGKFHKYTQAFKDERPKYEVYEAIQDADGNFVRGIWKRREEDEQGNEIPMEDYLTYKNKYFDFNENYDKAYFEDGVFTGKLMRAAGNSWTVKQEFVEIRDRAADGTDLRSAQWLKLTNPANERDRIMGEFYQFFTTELDGLMNLLPLSTRQEMMGRVPLVRGKFIEQVKKKGAMFFKVMCRNVTDWFKAHTITQPAAYTDDGALMNQLPVFYTGKLRDMDAIKKMEEELENLEKSRKEKKISKEKYIDEKDRIRNNIRAAESALLPEEVETDLLRVLGEFAKKTYEYDEMHRIEASLLAVQEVLDNRKYQKNNSRGERVMERIRGKVKPLEISGKNSNASKRMQAWMEMTFYGSPDLDRSMVDVYTKRFMNMTSLVNVGFNFFGAMHNYLMNRITMAIETWGGLYYKRSAGMEAVREYNRDYLPNAVKNMFRSLGASENYYHREPPSSKYEAVCRMFKIPRGGESTSGKPNLSTLVTFGYKLAGWAEFNTQSKVAVSVLKSKMVDGPQGPISMYDALTWKRGDNEAGFRKGYDIPPGMRHDTTNQIWEINKRMFGNYATEDRMLIEKYTLGKMAAQFHKWIYPLGRVRLHREYVDENLGWQEGRLRSAMEFVGFLRRAEGDWKAQMYGAMDKMNEVRAKNMYRNASELVFLTLSGCMYLLLKGLAAGMDDDDDRMKRLVNFLRYENTRQSQEIRFWVPGLNVVDVQELIKNPFAVAGSFKQYADVIVETFNLLAPPYDDKIYYQSGVYEGRLRLGKEVSDLLPVMKDINKWTSFAATNDFKIM
jgi:tRNA G26 N,N-dimethylase Trm1